MADNQANDISITVKDGIGKDSKKPWKGVLITVGEWSQLIFPKTKFEMDYIERILSENSN